MSQTPVYYNDYLKLDAILNANAPLSKMENGKAAHDEHLFITVHQAYELWFKQVLFEVDAVLGIFCEDVVPESRIGKAVGHMNRVNQIFRLLVEQFSVLETMTPLDFLDFRDVVNPASGFQSVQFRLLENTLGLKSNQRLRYERKSYKNRLSQEHQHVVSASEEKPTLFGRVEKWLERTPFLKTEDFNFWKAYESAVTKMLDNDAEIIRNNPHLDAENVEAELASLAQTRATFAMLTHPQQYEEQLKKGTFNLSQKATLAALQISLYRDEPVLHLPYQFLASLIEMDTLLSTWRSRHADVAQRMIGKKIGTGGSSGAAYLKAAANAHIVFNDLTALSTFMIPRSMLPELPLKLRKSLDFNFQALPTP